MQSTYSRIYFWTCGIMTPSSWGGCLVKKKLHYCLTVAVKWRSLTTMDTLERVFISAKYAKYFQCTSGFFPYNHRWIFHLHNESSTLEVHWKLNEYLTTEVWKIWTSDQNVWNCFKVIHRCSLTYLHILLVYIVRLYKPCV